jgi:glycosyltransferase involved in cell wall biosynthesis
VPARIPGLFLFVGALLRGKGLDTLLEALALLPAEVRLRVAGEGHQEGMFRSLAQSLGVVGRVEFLGRIPHADLSRHYREAACLVVPSRGPETFGLVGLEAFGHGTPVVASMAGGAGDWLIEGRTGFGFPPGDVQALASVLRRVLAEPAVALATAQRGRDLLQTRFSAERHLEALWNLFESLVRQGRQS